MLNKAIYLVLLMFVFGVWTGLSLSSGKESFSGFACLTMPSAKAEGVAILSFNDEKNLLNTEEKTPSFSELTNSVNLANFNTSNFRHIGLGSSSMLTKLHRPFLHNGRLII
jgi:hypothetical protein